MKKAEFNKEAHYIATLQDGDGDKLTITCPGGGRINHDVDSKKITIYGYSKGFGQYKHEKTREVLEKILAPYYKIECSNEGY